ncbi:3-isopropylmalate dehydratase [Mycobacterium asiaticum]|uniref:3-isopropylmalate dehydratase n=1 Tax=Mycobacterium asiaticum TaxID=1790 RepID=A0A1A3NQK7_MYCAS|nr:aconitase/3-isopropylmalate dehydratase large subunit family protein [Mycobacterium asiaticum]OBK24166.1 3-isopropylmalate dehydratase [Mycobacterium asiaticum]
MGLSLSDKVLRGHAVDHDPSAVIQQVRVDALLGHDATIGLLMERFEERGLRIWDPTRVIFTNDHFSPPATAERADISRRFIDFSRRQQVGNLLVDKGICHQLLVENRLCLPGSLIVGADSHTIMAGGVGACATGMGSTDIMFALATGTTWMRAPSTIKITFHGTLPPSCNGRDIVLHLLAELGEHGGRYRSLEFHDHAEPKLAQDERFAIANMAVEMGGKFGIFVPDEVTFAYLRQRDGSVPAEVTLPDDDADYEREVEVDLTRLRPMVAKPWSPANVIPVDALDPTPVTMAFLGSCSSGRLSDIKVAAEVLRGRQVDERVRFVVIPASVAVFQQALRMGYVETLTDAGALFNQSSCGPCGGIDKGVLGADDVCVSTSNRNFRGRMGHWDSRTYLASPRTVAMAALHGSLGGVVE